MNTSFRLRCESALTHPVTVGALAALLVALTACCALTNLYRIGCWRSTTSLVWSYPACSKS